VKTQTNRTSIQLYTYFVKIYPCNSCRLSYLKVVLFISFWFGRETLAIVIWSGCNTRHHTPCYWPMSFLLSFFFWNVSDVLWVHSKFYLLYTRTPLQMSSRIMSTSPFIIREVVRVAFSASCDSVVTFAKEYINRLNFLFISPKWRSTIESNPPLQ